MTTGARLDDVMSSPFSCGYLVLRTAVVAELLHPAIETNGAAIYDGLQACDAAADDRAAHTDAVSVCRQPHFDARTRHQPGGCIDERAAGGHIDESSVMPGCDAR
jgi:hypothetical protein